MLRVSVGLICILLPAMAHAQAFGVRMGTPVSSYSGKPVKGSAASFEIQVPEPNGEFESYLAVATPQTGICKVTGLGRTHKNDDYGTEARGAYAKIRESLIARYGSNKSFDFIQSGALWKQPREWVWSIFKKERILAAYWDHEEKSTLPPTIQSIGLHTKAVDSSGAYVTLAYEFTNFDTCVAAIRAVDNKGL